MSEKVCVFMDESGKDKKSLSIIGAIAIPQNYYESEKIQMNGQSHLIKREFEEYAQFFEVNMNDVKRLEKSDVEP